MNAIVINPAGADIESITATKERVLSDYTYNDSEGEVQTGTMPNNGAYSGTVSVNSSMKLGLGYYSSISISGPTLDGDAIASNVLSGKTFYSNSGTKKTGTMTNHGSVNTSVSVGGSYTGSAGYYSSIDISGPTLSGDAVAANVLSGKTFYSNSGTKRTGTMVDRGALTATLNNMTSTTYKNTSSGYYSSITVNTVWQVYSTSIEINGYYNNSHMTATGYWGVSTTFNTDASIKVFSSGGYIWMTRNAGSGSATAYVVKITKEH